MSQNASGNLFTTTVGVFLGLCLFFIGLPILMCMGCLGTTGAVLNETVSAVQRESAAKEAKEAKERLAWHKALDDAKKDDRVAEIEGKSWRTWTIDDGTFINGKLISVDSGVATLETDVGRREVALSQLSDADLEFIFSQMGNANP